MQLRDWQQQVQYTITEQNSMLPVYNNADSLLLDMVKSGALDVATRISIYSNAYVLRLTEALQSNYPMVHQLFGDDDFNATAALYIQTYPPEHASIRWFGEHLPQFLAQHQPYQGVPVFAELAKFEWAFRHTIDAEDAECITVEFMQGLRPEVWSEMCFRAHPSLTILPMQWNVPQIWQALNNHAEPPQPEVNQALWLIYRQKDYVTAWHSITDAELAAIEAMQSGKSFADICEALMPFVNNIDEVPAMAAGFLRHWVEQGIVAHKR